MFCNNVFRTDHSYTYSHLDRFKHYDLIRHKIYAATTKQTRGIMKTIIEGLIFFALMYFLLFYGLEIAINLEQHILNTRGI